MFIELKSGDGNSFIIHTCDLVKVNFTDAANTIEVTYTLNGKLYTDPFKYDERLDYEAIRDGIKRQLNLE